MSKAKSKLKTYNVNRRIEVWFEERVQAESFDDAVQKARDSTARKRLDVLAAAIQRGNVMDWNDLPGFGVTEAWE